MIEDVAAACRTARCQLGLVAPAAVAVGYATAAAEFSWSDGDIAVDVRRDEQGLLAVRRRQADRGSNVVAVSPQSGLGDDAAPFAAAYGVALIPRTELLAARAGKQIPTTAPIPTWRLALAGVCFALAILAYAFVPSAIDLRRAAEISAGIATVDREWRAAVQAEDELTRVSKALSDLSTFAATASPVLYLLSGLADALPQGSMLLTVRADTTTGTLVALTPSAAALVHALEAMSDVAAVEIAGPVTREVVEGAQLQRVTLRFWLQRERGGSTAAGTSGETR
ncbi:MAG: hypothetical protein GEU90_16795 [Gemmatimonas sp.]|nr:hypothetical protein [Gemmatimonas sp.]